MRDSHHDSLWAAFQRGRRGEHVTTETFYVTELIDLLKPKVGRLSVEDGYIRGGIFGGL